ncbi:hypothetical protein IWX50DRAFT_632411 [Phyllosticta citricarpa]
MLSSPWLPRATAATPCNSNRNHDRWLCAVACGCLSSLPVPHTVCCKLLRGTTYAHCKIDVSTSFSLHISQPASQPARPVLPSSLLSSTLLTCHYPHQPPSVCTTAPLSAAIIPRYSRAITEGRQTAHTYQASSCVPSSRFPISISIIIIIIIVDELNH